MTINLILEKKLLIFPAKSIIIVLTWKNSKLGVIAQLVEHCNGIAGVTGSNPVSSIKGSEDDYLNRPQSLVDFIFFKPLMLIKIRVD